VALNLMRPPLAPSRNPRRDTKKWRSINGLGVVFSLAACGKAVRLRLTGCTKNVVKMQRKSK